MGEKAVVSIRLSICPPSVSTLTEWPLTLTCMCMGHCHSSSGLKVTVRGQGRLQNSKVKHGLSELDPPSSNKLNIHWLDQDTQKKNPLHKWLILVPATDIKYSLDFLRQIRTAEAFEAVAWLLQRTWPLVEWRHFDVILLVDVLLYVDVVRA